MGTTADKLNKVLQTKEAIRTAINNKGGTLTTSDKFSDYATAIDNIQSGSENEPITITQNGTYTAPEGVGYSPINVNVPSKEEEIKSITITENGTTTVLPTTGKVLSKVDIVANVPQSGGVNPLQSLLDRTKSAKYLFTGVAGSLSNYTQFHNMIDSELEAFMSGVDTSKVTDMYGMFFSCSSLTAIPQFNTSSCTDMQDMFYDCDKLITVPQLDTSKVTNMMEMFLACRKLTTIPQFNTSSCTNMKTMFTYCEKLTTIPQLDTSKVTNMNKMFESCYKLTTVPQLDTNSCTNMERMFNQCYALTTVPQLDTSKVTNTSSIFSQCYNLTTIPQLDTSKVYNMRSMFYECRKLQTIDFTNMKISSTYDSDYFAYGCSSLTKLIIRNMDKIPTLNSNAFTGCYHFYGTKDNTYNPQGLKDGRIYIPANKVEELKVATNWSVFADIIMAVDFIDGEHISKLYIDKNELKLNTPRKVEIYLNEFTNTPTVDITISNESIAQINNIITTTEKITFEVIALGEGGNATITVNISGDYSKTLTIEVKYTPPMEYRVEEISEATYGFTLNNNEYYERTNKNVSSSYSLCKLVFNATEISNTLKLECINSGEGSFDFGILSNIDTTLTLSNNEDTSNVYKSFKGQSSTIPIVITYPEATVGEHFIYIKYRKDGGGDQGNDSLQFKVIS